MTTRILGWGLITFCLAIQSCHSQEPGDPKKTPTQKQIKANSTQEGYGIKLYKVSPIFTIYMSDTSRVFTNYKEAAFYFWKKRTALTYFSDSLLKVAVSKDSVSLEIKQAEILFDDLQEFSKFKLCKSQKKDLANMNQLGFFSPHSRIVSVKERKEVYDLFPENIKGSEVGRRTREIILDNLFERNKNHSIAEFSTKIQLREADLKQINLNEILKPYTKYTILIFGASWCRPCILEDKQLKTWLPAIDTSLVRILGLSIDSDMEKWKKYLQADNLPWKHYLLSGGWNNEMFKVLKIMSIPRNLLLDETGKILAENTDIRKILKEIPLIYTQ